MQKGIRCGVILHRIFYRECCNTPCFSYYMNDLIPVPDEMAGKYRYVTSLDELLAILNDK